MFQYTGLRRGHEGSAFLHASPDILWCALTLPPCRWGAHAVSSNQKASLRKTGADQAGLTEAEQVRAVAGGRRYRKHASGTLLEPQAQALARRGSSEEAEQVQQGLPV